MIACLTQLPNIVHSDTASESLYGKDWQKLRRKMKASHDDALILVWGNEADVRCAAEEIAIRAKEATIGVPSDTRQGLKDGTSGFERVLPGADRMYPDTDLPPLAIPAERLKRIAASLPEYVWDREQRYRSMGLCEDLVTALSLSRRADLFLRLVDELQCAPAFAAMVVGLGTGTAMFDSFGSLSYKPEVSPAVARRAPPGLRRIVDGALKDTPLRAHESLDKRF